MATLEITKFEFQKSASEEFSVAHLVVKVQRLAFRLSLQLLLGVASIN